MISRSSVVASLALALAACDGPPPAVAPSASLHPAAGAPPSTSAAAPAPLPPRVDRDFLRKYTESRGFSRGGPRAITLTPDGRSALFLRSEAFQKEQSLFELDVQTGAVRALLTPAALDKAPEHLTLEERARRERLRITANGLTAFELSKDGKTVVVTLSGKLYALDRATGKTRPVDVGKGAAIDPRLSPDGTLLAYVQDDDVHVVPLDGSAKARALTRGGTEDKPHGLADFIAAEELARSRGFWWSPDSKSIVYEEADASALEHFTIADPASPERPADRVGYPRPGKSNAVLRFGIVRVASPGATTWLEWDRAQMPYIANVVWDEGAPLSLVVLDRLQKNEAMLVVDDRSGKTREVLREHDDAWVNVTQGFPIDPRVPAWLPDGSAFVWWSEREGDGRFALVPAKDPANARWLTPAGTQATSLLDLDPVKRTAIVETTRDGLHYEVTRVPLDGGAATTIAKLEDGWVGAHFDEPHDTFVAREGSLSGARRSVIRSLDGTIAREVPTRAEVPPTPHVTVEEVGPEKIRVSLVRPHDFVAGARYPLIDSAYAGPTTQVVSLDASSMVHEQWIADATGAIVVSIDAKGTPGRGRAWERALLGKLGSVPLDGHVQAIQELAKAHPEIDGARVGVYGWSFGGYFSTLAVLKRPDVYLVGVSIAPGADWRDYDTGYTERYLGLPEANAAAYDAASLLVAAKEPPPSGRQPTLLICHGTADDNVYFFNSLKLVDALAKAGRDFTFLPFLGQTHQFAQPEAEAAVWLRAAETLRRGLHPGE